MASKISHALKIAILVIGIFLTQKSHAFSVHGFKWATNTASFYVNPNIPEVADANEINAITAAAAQWSSIGGTPFYYSYAGTTNINSITYGNPSAVFYSPTDAGGPLAITYFWALGALPNAHLVQFAIVTYDNDGALNFIWNTNPPTPTWNNFDLQSVLTHEFGHALGLNHSAVSGTTMYPSVAPGSRDNRTLESDDINGIHYLYGSLVASPPKYEIYGIGGPHQDIIATYVPVGSPTNGFFHLQAGPAYAGWTITLATSSQPMAAPYPTLPNGAWRMISTTPANGFYQTTEALNSNGELWVAADLNTLGLSAGEHVYFQAAIVNGASTITSPAIHIFN